MTKTYEEAIEAWRASLPEAALPRLGGFLQRNAPMVHQLVSAYRVREGATPTGTDWAAYSALVRSLPGDERAALPTSDSRIITLIESKVVSFDDTVEYVECRAEALLLRAAAWDAVALRTARPVLVCVSGGEVDLFRHRVGFVRSPTIYGDPERAAKLQTREDEFTQVLSNVEAALVRHRESLKPPTVNTGIDAYARSIWALARKGAAS